MGEVQIFDAVHLVSEGERGGAGRSVRAAVTVRGSFAEREVRDQRARQPAGGAGVVHVRAAPRHGVGARHGHPRVRRARAHAPVRVPARRQALRVHRLPGLQRVRDLPGRHVQHGDGARVPAAGLGAGARRGGAAGGGGRARHVDGLALVRRVGGRGLPAGAGGRRAGAGPRLRLRAPARHRPPRRGRHHQVSPPVRHLYDITVRRPLRHSYETPYILKKYCICHRRYITNRIDCDIIQFGSRDTRDPGNNFLEALGVQFSRKE